MINAPPKGSGTEKVKHKFNKYSFHGKHEPAYAFKFFLEVQINFPPTNNFTVVTPIGSSRLMIKARLVVPDIVK